VAELLLVGAPDELESRLLTARAVHFADQLHGVAVETVGGHVRPLHADVDRHAAAASRHRLRGDSALERDLDSADRSQAVEEEAAAATVHLAGANHHEQLPLALTPAAGTAQLARVERSLEARPRQVGEALR